MSKKMRNEIERRVLSVQDLRVEARAVDDEAPVIRGYAAVFNKWADLGWFRERINPGAFAKTITEADVRALWNHDSNWVLGRNKAGTLDLSEDQKGLAVTITPPDTQWARDLMTSMTRGDVNQMSFAFTAIKEEWNQEKMERTLSEVRLYDVSVVTYPAYPQTSAAVRALASESGVDLDVIGGVLFRAGRGFELTEEDRASVRSAIELLRGILPEANPATNPEPVNPSHSGGEPVASHSDAAWADVLARAQIVETELFMGGIRS